MKETKLFELVTGTEMKPWLSGNVLPNINTCENGWSNFSANRRVVSLKLIELTQFTWPNPSIYFNFLCAVPRDDVIERRLINRSVGAHILTNRDVCAHILTNRGVGAHILTNRDVGAHILTNHFVVANSECNSTE